MDASLGVSSRLAFIGEGIGSVQAKRVPTANAEAAQEGRNLTKRFENEAARSSRAAALPYDH